MISIYTKYLLITFSKSNFSLYGKKEFKRNARNNSFYKSFFLCHQTEKGADFFFLND